MDLETAQTTITTKLPILKQGEYDMWRLRIKQYFQVQDYDLWDIIENGNSFKPVPQTTTNTDGSSTLLIPGPVTNEEKVQKKNDVKARSMLLMALPNEHLITFNQYKDAQTLFADIQIRFGGFRRLNKPDLDTMSFDDLYNNFNIVEQKVKGTASSSSSSQNMAFVSSPSSTNEVNTTYGVSTTNTQVSPARTQVSTVSTANLSDDTIYAFLASQPNGSQLVYEDLEQIHEDDIKEMNLKWQLALLSMRTRSYMADDEVPTNIALMAFSDSEITDKSRKGVGFVRCNAVPPPYTGLFLPLNLDLSYSSLEEFQQPEFKGYGHKPNDKLEKKTVSPTIAKIEFVRPKQQEKPIRTPCHPQKEDQGYVDSRCSRHMTGIMYYLSDFKEFDGGYVTFGGGAKRGKITSKGTLKTGKLDFEDVYFVKELQYVLTVNPTIYTSCIKQFWATSKAKTVNREIHIQALVDGKKVIVTETSVRITLQLKDAKGTECLPNATIFEQLTLMGYENLTQKLTFYEAFFSPQWKFLIHTILQCISANTRSVLVF
ncbi:hypothetical protein Tco_0767451 [Tanacetum coccineum]